MVVRRGLSDLVRGSTWWCQIWFAVVFCSPDLVESGGFVVVEVVVSWLW
jgi:hypothetical protein